MVANFAELGIDKDILAKLSDRHIVSPTPVQRKAIPEIRQGKDLIIRSQTGTGKTLAYLLPGLQSLELQSKQVQVIILAPTHELAMQIFKEAEWLSEHTDIRCQALIGGASVQRQIEKLKRHPQLVVGTPGRIAELVKKRKLKLHDVHTVIVDEADHVFELGASNDVETILGSTMNDRQVLFLSATLPQSIRSIADQWMNKPQTLEPAPEEVLPEQIEHGYIRCEEREKISTLRRLIRNLNPASAMIFTNEVDSIGSLLAKLQYMGFEIEAIYGEAGKMEREQTMKRFRQGKLKLLISTEMAARGLDVEHVTHVFNLDIPLNADLYVHRAGRTGRMGRSGTVLTFCTDKQVWIMEKLARQLHTTIAPLSLVQGKLVEASAQSSNGKKPTDASDARSRGQAVSKKPVSRSHPKKDKTPSGPGQKKSGSATGKRKKESSKNKGAPRWLKSKWKEEGSD